MLPSLHRSQVTVNDVELAKAELAQLEHRFRLRVEQGQSILPSLAPRAVRPTFSPSTTVLQDNSNNLSSMGSLDPSWISKFIQAIGQAPVPNINNPASTLGSTNGSDPTELLLKAFANQNPQLCNNPIPFLQLQLPLNQALISNILMNYQATLGPNGHLK